MTTYCGAWETFGHGENEICGRVGQCGKHQCPHCKLKDLEMKTIEEHKADVEAHQKQVDAYAAALPARPLGSGVLCHVPVELRPNTALLKMRIKIAEMRLRFDLRVELLVIGSNPSEEELDRMIQGIPRDTYDQLVTKRT